MMAARHFRGVAMIELLVAMLVIAFGVLGFVGLQAKTALTQVEGYQRSQALFLINDIAERMSMNRPAAASYLGSDIGVAALTGCATPASQAIRDLCEWSALLQGAAETLGTVKLGAMIGARGCIVADPGDPASGAFLITVAWQGIQATGAPNSNCGANQYSAENLRRSVTKVVRFASLNTP
jgi:type IV pilus assembly protein PilV